MATFNLSIWPAALSQNAATAGSNNLKDEENISAMYTRLTESVQIHLDERITLKRVSNLAKPVPSSNRSLVLVEYGLTFELAKETLQLVSLFVNFLYRVHRNQPSTVSSLQTLYVTAEES